MKKQNYSKNTLPLFALLALTACGGSSDSDPADIDNVEPVADNGEPATDNVEPVALVPGACPLVGNLQSLELATNECQISGVLTEDATLTADRTWFLEGALQIGSGETAATLDIEGGTQIRGDNQDVTDYVLVYPGSSLNANGTGANPVHFLSDDDDVDGSGEWGGVFLRGFNGLSAEGTQGSNRLDYVVVAEAGAAVEVTIDAQSVTYTDNLSHITLPEMVCIFSTATLDCRGYWQPVQHETAFGTVISMV